MTRRQVAEFDSEILLMDGFDDCIAGVATRCGGEQFAVYDYDLVISKLQSDGMTYEEAVEYHDFNQLGACSKERMPAFIRTKQP